VEAGIGSGPQQLVESREGAAAAGLLAVDLLEAENVGLEPLERGAQQARARRDGASRLSRLNVAIRIRGA
jgi:hypothetical protein